MSQSTDQFRSCSIVIFGVTGDLTRRKLIPALYRLFCDRLLPVRLQIMGFARRDWSQDYFKQRMHEALVTSHVSLDHWEEFSCCLKYHRCHFDESYDGLREVIQKWETEGKQEHAGNRLFYLATPPSHFTTIIDRLGAHGLIYPYKQAKNTSSVEAWSRVVIEKPFGHSFASSKALQQHITQVLSEDQIFRIDHYLGKETVQNILALRFGNSIFESLWNHRYVESVHITVSEHIGIEGRGAFFEESGFLRDIVQNHMMQLLSLIAMEPPISLLPDAVRDEKVKALQALRLLPREEVNNFVVRGQYGPGSVHGKSVGSYRDEEGVHPDSCTETFVFIKTFIDSWRWSGVPFYLCGGKRLEERKTEINIVFKKVPGMNWFGDYANILRIRIQPDEGIALSMSCKEPGLPQWKTGSTRVMNMRPVEMNFRYEQAFSVSVREPYERLIFDSILGDTTLFARDDEVFASWAWIDSIIKGWKEGPKPSFPNYISGTWGPPLDSSWGFSGMVFPDTIGER